MNLFHHTHLCHLKSILADGLKACRLDWPDLADRCGVWLTTDDRWMGRDIRVKVVIPSTDRRLVHVAKLLRRRLQPWELARMDAIGVQAAHWRGFYLYGGNIAQDRFITVEQAVKSNS